MTSAQLLSSFESCQRAGFWSRSWQQHRMTPIQMLHEAVNRALLEDHDNPGENAGEHFVTLASERGLDLANPDQVYLCAMNHAAIADILVTAMKPEAPWSVPSSSWWKPSCLQYGAHLRRFLAVSHWNEERELFERRSWYCLGEICHYRMPMQLIVANIGHMSGGRRTGHWSKAQLHPNRSHVRFRRRARKTIEGFKETWIPIYREEHAEIDREDWLQGMLNDGVLQESLFVINIPVPEEEVCERINALAQWKIQALLATRDVPPFQLSTCFDPIAPCPFRYCCHSLPAVPPSEKAGFDRHETTLPTRPINSASPAAAEVTTPQI